MRKLTPTQVAEIKDRQDVTLLNVAPPDEYEAERIPGSHHVPAEAADFVERVANAVGDKQKKIVVYDTAEKSPITPKVAKRLEKAGFAEVFDFSGGLTAWKNARMPFECGSSFKRRR